MLYRVLHPYMNYGFRQGVRQGKTRQKAAAEDEFDYQVLYRLRRKSLYHASLAVGTTKEELQKLLTTALTEGQSIQQLGKAINDYFSLNSKKRSLVIARTELTDTINDGTLHAIQREGYAQKEWSTVLDGRERESHHQANGQVVGMYESFIIGGSPAKHPGDDSLPPGERINCFLPGTTVRGRVNLAMRSFYSGQAVEIVTLVGNVLRVTQNHPVLTKDGFVPAGSLKEGDEVLGYVGHVHLGGRPAGTLPSNEDHEPPLVEEVFRSLSGFDLRELPRARPDDFHGDGQFTQGDIEVVGAYRELLDGREAGGLDQCGDLVLERPLAQLPLEHGHRPLLPLLNAVGSARAGFPGAGALPLDGRPVELQFAPLQEFRFGPTADVNPGLFERRADGGAGDVELFRDLLLGHPGLVQADRITSLRRFHFSGHVYDVQAPNGWIVASNIVTSNCRCAIVAAGLPDDRVAAMNQAFLRTHGSLERMLMVALAREFGMSRRRVLAHFPSP